MLRKVLLINTLLLINFYRYWKNNDKISQSIDRTSNFSSKALKSTEKRTILRVVNSEDEDEDNGLNGNISIKDLNFPLISIEAE